MSNFEFTVQWNDGSANLCYLAYLTLSEDIWVKWSHESDGIWKGIITKTHKRSLVEVTWENSEKNTVNI